MLDIVLAVIALAGNGDMPSGDQKGDAAMAVSSELVAEEQVRTGKFTTALEVKPILSATKGNWVAVREWEGQDLIYVTHLWAWRCGLLRMEVSVNGGALEVWPLPACHLDTASPGAIIEGDGLPYRVFDLQSVDQIDVRITYDDLSVDQAQFARRDVLMP